MSVSETELEQLELYLDGDLEPTVMTAVSDRLTADSTLSQALTELRTQRSVRRAVWQSTEPSQASAEQFMWRIRGAMFAHDSDNQRDETSTGLGATDLGASKKPAREFAVATARPGFNWSPWRVSGLTSAAAACLALGFFAGRAGRVMPTQSTSPLNATLVSSTSSHHESGLRESGLHESATGDLASRESGGNSTIATSHAAGNAPLFVRAETVPQVVVPITNEYGQVVAWQKFDNADQAKNFEEDLHRAHASPVTPMGQQPKLASQTEVHF